MIVWRLKKGSEKKFRSGHPWVFSSELAQSPKGLPAGSLVDLHEYGGAFLARGYGHPNSLISFRTLTKNRDEAIDRTFFFERLKRASEARWLTGVGPFSHRLCFAEADGLPGLIIDRYRLATDASPGQVFVIQSSTAGMDQLLALVFEALEDLVAHEREQHANQPSWESTAIVLANDSKSRQMENIAVEAKNVKKTAPGFIPESTKILVQPGLAHLAPVHFEVDLIGGQKTGFFLDQRLNVHLASSIAQEIVRLHGARGVNDRPIQILDLCCYVGQWGTQLAHLCAALGVRAEVTLADASARALEIAARNVEAAGGIARVEKMDVLDELGRLPRRAYDIVICDPPAFIKKKKDLPTGSAAYLKLNREAMKRTSVGGLFVSCSCSGLFAEEDFRQMLAKAVTSFEGEIRWLLRGSHSPDHPQRPEFPQGTYLKSWMGIAVR